jgi:DNA-binding HxlR family transcriptional regulator
VFVMTVDQQGSRRVGDRVESLLVELASLYGRDGVVRGFERTVGDEVQAVLDDPALVVDVTLRLLRLGGWSVGIGAGAVTEPLPPSSRAGSGEAFVLARTAVERAKSRTRPVPLAVEAQVTERGRDAEAVLTLLGTVVSRRSAAGWAVVDALGRLGGSARQDEVAASLGVTQQAVSQRLRTAMWAEEVAARPVAARLLDEGDR